MSAPSGAIIASHSQHSTSSACIVPLLTRVAHPTHGHGAGPSARQRTKQESCQRLVVRRSVVVEQRGYKCPALALEERPGVPWQRNHLASPCLAWNVHYRGSVLPPRRAP